MAITVRQNVRMLSPSSEFIYAIEGFGDQVVVHYPPIPYTPAP